MEIEKVVHRQASTGLRLATDGDSAAPGGISIFSQLTGCELFHPEVGIQFAGVRPAMTRCA